MARIATVNSFTPFFLSFRYPSYHLLIKVIRWRECCVGPRFSEGTVILMRECESSPKQRRWITVALSDDPGLDVSWMGERWMKGGGAKLRIARLGDRACCSITLK